MNIKNKKAFTLVELIVVIIIIGILGTIAFVSLQGYSSQARDSKRISEYQNIKTSLELFSINTGKYPLPDNPGTFSFSGDLLWTQGVIGDKVFVNLSKNLQKKPVDPLTELEYTYSVTNTQKEYEIMMIYESDLISKEILAKTYALSNYNVKVSGNYNGLYVESSNYIIPTPTIINAEVAPINMTESNLEPIKSGVITGGENFPNVGITTIETKTGQLDINPVFTIKISEDSSQTDKINLINTIQSAYTGTIFANIDIYKEILSVTTNEDKLSYVNTTILKLDTNETIQQNEPIIDNTPLYTFTNHTFTSCGVTGQNGPTLTQCLNSYDTLWETNTGYYDITTQGIQEWTVPETGVYSIQVAGAAGGTKYTNYGKGIIIKGNFNLNKNDKLKLLVGQKGVYYEYMGGGGGGTFVVKSDNSPLIIAGAGGGGGRDNNKGTDATINGSGTAPTNGPTGQQATFGKGGTNGGGGGGGTAGCGAGGGGLYGNGGDGTRGSPCSAGGNGGDGVNGSNGGCGSVIAATGGKAFINGGAGGGYSASQHYAGGFGGGGGVYRRESIGGGGGGYSGGGGAGRDYNISGAVYAGGGGGGSYNSGEEQTNVGTNTGDGYIIITKL